MPIVMDVALPQLSGFEVVTRIEPSPVATPVMFLSGFSDVSHRVRGLAVGADDYLGAPFSMEELGPGSGPLPPRPGTWPPSPTEVGPWTVDPLLREVRVCTTRIALQPREWSVFQLFLRHGQSDQAFLLEQAWGLPSTRAQTWWMPSSSGYAGLDSRADHSTSRPSTAHTVDLNPPFRGDRGGTSDGIPEGTAESRAVGSQGDPAWNTAPHPHPVLPAPTRIRFLADEVAGI